MALALEEDVAVASLLVVVASLQVAEEVATVSLLAVEQEVATVFLLVALEEVDTVSLLLIMEEGELVGMAEAEGANQTAKNHISWIMLMTMRDLDFSIIQRWCLNIFIIFCMMLDM